MVPEDLFRTLGILQSGVDETYVTKLGPGSISMILLSTHAIIPGVHGIY